MEPSVCTKPTGVLCEDEETCDGVGSPVETLGEPEVKDSSLDLIAMTTGLSGFAEEVEEGLVLRTPPPESSAAGLANIIVGLEDWYSAS